MAKGGGGVLGSGMFAIQIPIEYVTSTATAALQTVDAAANATGAKIDAHAMKLRQLWAYGNQMVSLILNITQRAVKGTAAEAKVQEALAIAQLAQSEYAVGLTTLQAMAAYALPGGVGIPQGLILTAIVIAMQSGIMVAQFNKAAAAQAKRQAEELAQEIETYRS